MDAYLQGFIPLEELTRVRLRCDEQRRLLMQRIEKKPEELQWTEEFLSQKLKEILGGNAGSDAFLRSLLDWIQIHEDRTVEVKLCQCPVIFRFRII